MFSLLNYISDYQYEILVILGAFSSLYFEKEHIDTRKDKIIYVIIGIIAGSVIFPFIIGHLQIDPERVQLLRIIAFFVGALSASVLKAVKRTIDATDFWEFIKEKLGG